MIARATALRLLLFLAFACPAATGCGGDRFIVVGTAKAPSVSGWVNIKGASKTGAEVTVHLEQLHPPNHLDSSLKSYVVWFEPNGQPPQNMGTIKVNDNLESEFQTRTPFKVFKVYVTAEEGPKVTTPSSDHILEANVDRG